MRRFALIIALVLCLACPAWSATYNWYFSNSGNDTTGDGSQGNPWATVTKLRSWYVGTASSSDIVNAYFNRGDTWDFGVAGANVPPNFNISGVTLNIDAYGSGALPIWDGAYVTASDPDARLTTAYLLQMTEGTLSIQHIRFQYTAQHAIFFNDNTNNGHSVKYCEFDHLGKAAVYPYLGTGTIEIAYNDIEYCGMRYILGDDTDWPQSINANGSTPHGQIWIHDNYIYSSGGEGTGTGNAIVEYNTIVRWHTVGVYIEGSGAAIVRYNLLIGSPSGLYTANQGITVNHENCSANVDNSKVYGNTIIGAKDGIKLGNDCTGLSGSYFIDNVSIYYNTVINSVNKAISCYRNLAKFVNLTIIDNSFIDYGGSTSTMVGGFTTGSWDGTETIGPNHWHFAVTGNMADAGDITGDPLLNKTSGWDSITAASDISFNDLVPTAVIIGTATVLGAGYETQFLTEGTTGFWEVPADTANFVRIAQPSPPTFGANLPYAGSPPTPPTSTWGTDPESFEQVSDGDTDTNATVTDTDGVISTVNTSWSTDGAQCLKLTLRPADSGPNFVSMTLPSPDSDEYYRFGWKLGTLNDAQIAYLFYAGDTANSLSDAVIAIRAVGTPVSTVTRIYLYNGTAASTNYFELTTAATYAFEIEAVDNGTCTLRVYDYLGNAVDHNGAAADLTLAGSDQDDSGTITFPDNIAAGANVGYYVDNVRYSDTTWFTGGAAAPTVIGWSYFTESGGAFTYSSDDPNISIRTPGYYYFGAETDLALTVILNPAGIIWPAVVARGPVLRNMEYITNGVYDTNRNFMIFRILLHPGDYSASLAVSDVDGMADAGGGSLTITGPNGNPLTTTAPRTTMSETGAVYVNIPAGFMRR